MKDFNGKVVVITGAGSGIGRATAIAFAREGAKLHIADIVEEGINSAVEEIKQMGGKAYPYVVDVSDREAMEKFANNVFEAAGRVDVLHNNAGIGLSCAVHEVSLEDWERIINVNLWGPIYGMHFFVPRMIEQGGGHVINTSSAAGLTAVPTLSAYVTTKFALVGLSEAMSIELQRHGIHTTALGPGIINTPLIESTPTNIVDRDGKSLKDSAVKFYAEKGAGPEVVAKDVLKAVREKSPVKPSPPFHVYPLWLIKRFMGQKVKVDAAPEVKVYAAGHEPSAHIEIAKSLQVVVEENPTHMYGGFSRYINETLAGAGEIGLKISSMLGFPEDQVKRYTIYAAKFEPACYDNLLGLAKMYISFGRMEEAKETLEQIINGDPAVLKYIESENRLNQKEARKIYDENFK